MTSYPAESWNEKALSRCNFKGHDRVYVYGPVYTLAVSNIYHRHYEPLSCIIYLSQ